MPKRIASMKNRIAANGAALHRAREGGQADAEAALADERKQLKEELAQRKARSLLPGPTALDKLVRTHHPEARSKAKKDKAHDDVKKPKARRSRAEKHAEQAAAIEAARHRTSAKKPTASK